MLKRYAQHSRKLGKTYMLEKTVEKHLRKQVINCGGKCYKWSSPANKGVPDRVIFIFKQVWFIETKSPTGELSPLQKVVGNDITEHTDYYAVISTIEEVDRWIKHAQIIEKLRLLQS
jgi:hypothetical protein